MVLVCDNAAQYRILGGSLTLLVQLLCLLEGEQIKGQEILIAWRYDTRQKLHKQFAGKQSEGQQHALKWVNLFPKGLMPCKFFFSILFHIIKIKYHYNYNVQSLLVHLISLWLLLDLYYVECLS